MLSVSPREVHNTGQTVRRRDESSETRSLREKWNQRYLDTERDPPPASVLTENLHLLPSTGRALDLACGLGANALLLAQQGLDVIAWDLSPVAVDRLNREAKRQGLRVLAEVRNVCERPPEPETFDIILVSYFLDRGLAPALAEALRPTGLLLYQTFSQQAVSACGPSNPAYRLATNELLSLFSRLLVRFYREEGRLGDPGQGTRDVAQLIAQKAEQ